MPAVRKVSKQLNLSYQTVNRSYELLRGRGLVERKAGSGTYVRREVLNQLRVNSNGYTYEGYMLDTQRLGSVGHLRSLASPIPDVELFHADEMDYALREAVKRGASSYAYSWLGGEQDLLVQLAKHARAREISAMPGEILVVPGATVAISMVIQTVCKPGDAVLVETPAYIGVMHLLQVLGMQVIPVETDAQGFVPAAVDQLAATHKPTLMFANPTFQNPRGAVMSLARRKEILALANKHKFYILEDDVSARLDYEVSALPPLKALDDRGRVIYVDSLSKCLVPGIRVGYIIPPRAIAQNLASIIDAHILSGSPILQNATAIYMAEGFLEKHLMRVLPKYKARRDAMLEALTGSMPSGTEWTRPAGGLSLWVNLPRGGRFSDIYAAAGEAGVSYTPGECFLSTREERRALRLSFGSLSPRGLRESVEKLGSLVRARV